MYFLPLFTAQFVALVLASYACSQDLGPGVILGVYCSIAPATFILMSVLQICIWRPQPAEIEIQHDILALNEARNGP